MKDSVLDLWQGISTQPPWRRFKGQVDDATNMVPDLSDGIRKRNPLEYIADIPTTTLDPDYNYAVTSLRNYRIFVGDNKIIVLDEDGDSVTVNDNTGTGFAYLDGATNSNIAFAASVDTIIIAKTDVELTTSTTAAYTVKHEVEVYSDLTKAPEDTTDPNPLDAQAGDTWRTLVAENNDPAGYYRWDGNEWTRVPPPRSANGHAVRTTWPHRLVYDPDSQTFTYDSIPFNDRLSGNDTTNPEPTVAAATVKAVAFFAGRLVMVSRDAVFCTAANDIFTIFINDVNNIVDSDPIDISITQKNIGEALYAETLGRSVLILCENGQLCFQSDADLITPVSSPYLRQVGSYKTLAANPGVSGERLIMMDSYKLTRVFAYDPQVRGCRYLGSTNEHVKHYFDNYTPTRLCVDDNITYICTAPIISATQTVFVHYLYQNNDGTLAQSAWSKMTYYDTVKYVDRWEDKTRFVTNGDFWTLLEYIEPDLATSFEFDFSPRLDRLQTINGTYIPADDVTEFTLDGLKNVNGDLYLATTYDAGDLPSNIFLQPISYSGTTFRVRGKWDDYSHYAGFAYQSSVELGYIYAGATSNRVWLTGLSIFHKNTTNYTLSIGLLGADDKVYNYDSRSMNTRELTTTNVSTGVQDYIVLGDGREVSITVSNDSPGTLTFSAYEIKAHVKGRV